MSETYLSPETHARLVEELEDLTTRGRIDIARAIEAARALGDLSENGAQGKMEARIRQLQATLDQAVIVAGSSAPAGVISTGTVVGFRYEGDDEVEHYLLGSIEERHGEYPVVSPGSPLGQALLGKKAGDVVTYDAPNGKLSVEIVSVE
jgi:transcription elongation factor GreA